MRLGVLLLSVVLVWATGVRAEGQGGGSKPMVPRIFMTPSGVTAARAGAADPIQAMLSQAVLGRADEALRELPRYLDPTDPSRPLPALRPWPSEREGEMGELLKIRMDARDVQALAVAYSLTGRRAYAEKAWSDLHAMLSVYQAFGSFDPVRRNNDLAAAEAYRGMAMAWDLCGDTLPPETRALVLTEGVRRARDMYATAVRDWRINGLPVPFETPGVSPEKGPDNRNIFAMLMTNHCWVNIASLGLLGMALEGEDVSAAGPGSTPEDWLRFARHFFGYLTEILPADGSYPESRVYGAPYGEEGAMPFLRALRRVEGLDLFARTPFFRNIAYARLYAVWDHERHRGVSNFGEGGDSEWQSPAWIHTCAAAYRDPVLQWSANAWTRAAVPSDDLALQYLAYDPSLKEVRPEEAGLPTALLLPDMSEVYIRGGGAPWGEESAVLSFRGSVTGRAQYRLKGEGKIPYITAWHSHESRNAVLLAVGGQALIGRSTRGEPGTEHYSVLQVNGKDQREPDHALEGIQDFDATDHYVTFSSEIGAAYEDLESYRRRVVYMPPDLYVLADSAKAPAPVRMDYRLHFGRQVRAESVSSGEAAARLQGSIGEGVGTVRFTCEVVSCVPVVAALEPPPGRNASQTLRYGPSAAATESQALAIIRVGGTQEWAMPLRSSQPGLLGAVLPESRLAVVAADAGDSTTRPIQATYSVPRSAGVMRHLVTGMRQGSYRVSVQAQGDRVVVTLSPGHGIESSPQGTLLFQVVSDGSVQPVTVHAQREVLFAPAGAPPAAP